MHVSYNNNFEQLRYEVHADGTLAGMAEYRMADPREVMFVHTEVRAEYEGFGLANQLAQYALEDARVAGVTVVPACPFMAEFLRRHRTYIDLVRPELRQAFGV